MSNPFNPTKPQKEATDKQLTGQEMLRKAGEGLRKMREDPASRLNQSVGVAVESRLNQSFNPANESFGTQSERNFSLREDLTSRDGPKTTEELMQEAIDKFEENLPQLKSHGHSVAAFALHLIILLSADHPLKLIEPTNAMIGILVLVSGSATYKYFSNSKTYDVFNYEQVF